MLQSCCNEWKWYPSKLPIHFLNLQLVWVNTNIAENLRFLFRVVCLLCCVGFKAELSRWQHHVTMLKRNSRMLPWCHSLLSIAVINTVNFFKKITINVIEKHPGEETVIWLTHLDHRLSLRELRAGTDIEVQPWPGSGGTYI